MYKSINKPESPMNSPHKDDKEDPPIIKGNTILSESPGSSQQQSSEALALNATGANGGKKGGFFDGIIGGGAGGAVSGMPMGGLLVACLTAAALDNCNWKGGLGGWGVL